MGVIAVIKIFLLWFSHMYVKVKMSEQIINRAFVSSTLDTNFCNAVFRCYFIKYCTRVDLICSSLLFCLRYQEMNVYMSVRFYVFLWLYSLKIRPIFMNAAVNRWNCYFLNLSTIYQNARLLYRTLCLEFRQVPGYVFLMDLCNKRSVFSIINRFLSTSAAPFPDDVFFYSLDTRIFTFYEKITC